MRSLLGSGFLLLTLALAPGASAQGTPEADAPGAGIRFNGLGRSYIQQTDLGGTLADVDTSTAQRLTDGEFLLDLAVSAQPNRVTEIQGVIRLRNEFGGFFGSGATVEIRELWARGIVANAVEYRLGDMDVAMTPYTVFLPDEDGTVNEPELFQPQREVINYEEFYTGRNTRRFQGGRLGFTLDVDKGLESVETNVFLARLRATNFTTTPTRLIAGGRLGLTSPTVGPFGSKATIGSNLAYTWDDLESGDANTGIRNSVLTFDTDVTLYDQGAWDLHLVGEAGRSVVQLKERPDEPADGSEAPEVEPLIDDSDTFVEVGLAGGLEARGLGFTAMFVDVGPDFYSAAAQSKRVDYTRRRSSFNRLGNDQTQRPVNLFDLSRDPAVYTFRVANELMTYDPRYSNVQPYGRATPNRRGVRLGTTFAPAESPFDLGLEAALLTEIRGQGTTELKDFVLVRASADLDIAPLIGSTRMLGSTLGLQFESTNRGGEEVEQVDLTSFLLEAGVSAEIYTRLDLMLGAKFRTSSGRDYVPQIRDFNDVRDFPASFDTNDSENLLGAGLRYRFKEGVYLTVQYQRFSYSADAEQGTDPLVDPAPTPEDNYRFGQAFALYSMSF